MPLPAELLALLQQAQIALNAEAAAVTSADTIHATGGVLVKSTASGLRYKFQLELDDATCPEGPVLLTTAGMTVKGTLDRITGGNAIVTAARDLGPRPGRMTISADTVYLLIRLRDVLRSYENQSAPFNVDAVLEAMGLALPRVCPSPRVRIPTDLTPDQAEVVRAVATRSMTPVQGPAGTGKSTTNGAVVAEQALQGERVLIVSNTNVAIDNALSHVLGRIRPDQLGSPHSILRLGPSVELEEHEEQMIGARILAEGTLPEVARPTLLRELRRRSLRPIEEIDGVRALGQLNAAPEDALTRWIAALCMAADVLHAADAAVQEALGVTLTDIEDGVPTEKRPRRKSRPQRKGKPRRAMYDEILDVLVHLDRPLGPELRIAVVQFVAALRGFDDLLDRLKEVIDKIERGLIAEARIVGATLAKATVTDVVMEGEFDLVVIDEVSMANLAQVMAVVGRARRACVLVGDFRQLAPIAVTRDREAKAFLERDVFEQMGIVDTVDEGREDQRLVMLTTQFRMHADIAAGPSKLFYGGRLKTHRSVGKRDVLPLPFLRTKRRVAVVDTGSLGPWCIKSPGTHSRLNPMHAAVSVAVVAHLKAAGFPLDEIGVVSPHAQHARLVQNLLEDHDLGAVTSATVHRFQGLQREAIVLDLADCGPCKVSQLLRPSKYHPADMVRRLLNVAITRPKQALIVVANWGCLKDACPEGTPLRRLFAERGYGPPFTNAADLIGSSPLADRLTVHEKDDPVTLPVVSDADVTLVVGQVDVVGLLRTLDVIGHGTRVQILYRAEGAIGLSNIEALGAALENTGRDVIAIGIEALLADALLLDNSTYVYTSPPWDLRTSDRRAMTISGEEFKVGLERALRVEDILALAGGTRGLALCRTCGAPLVGVVLAGRVRTRCGCAAKASAVASAADATPTGDREHVPTVRVLPCPV